MLVMKHFHPFLIPDKKSTPEPQHPSVWVNMSARVGSIGDNVSGGWYSYRASKAGLNAATKSFDLFLQQRCGAAAMAVSMHPGTVRTGLSKEFWDHVPKEKLFEPEDAAGKVVGVVQAMRKEQRGKFWDWKGENIEW